MWPRIDVYETPHRCQVTCFCQVEHINAPGTLVLLEARNFWNCEQHSQNADVKNLRLEPEADCLSQEQMHFSVRSGGDHNTDLKDVHCQIKTAICICDHTLES